MTLLKKRSTINFFHSFILGCEFPQEWQGEWNLEGERESLQISEEDFGTKGKVIDTKYYKQTVC